MVWFCHDSNLHKSHLDQLVDLTKYDTTPVDGGVVAWVEHSQPKDHSMKFDIKAQVLKASNTKASAKEEL